ncbi:MAG TPA: beta-galactosidase [Galbitalea sp.]|jgi:beta-galactosidase|nr:beta-galactosidase [Galbitalea sp.]
MTTLGAQYYRPPNPPREDWRRDLERMKSAGMNTVKFWGCWSWIDQGEGHYDFEDLAELLDFAGELGLDVVINTIIENAPYWLERRAPQARYRDQDGREIHLTAAMNTPGGGWPGLCFDNAEVRDVAGDFLTELVRRFDGHPALSTWDVWNEPHLEPASYFPDRIFCYCDASVAKFLNWLKAKYQTIDGVNAAWSRRFSDWSEVAPPRVYEAVPDMLDWREFWIENLRSWLDWRVSVVRDAGSAKTVMTHVALSGFTGQLATHSLDEFTLTDSVDAFGTSSFPTWLMADDHVEHLFNLDTARDAARGKPFWQAEIQGGRGRRDGLRSTGQPHPDTVSLWMWNALAAGATGIVFWQWRPELLGPESPGYGLCAPDGSLTSRVAAVSRFAEIASMPILVDRSTEAAQVGLLVSRKTALHAYATDRTMDLYRDAVMGAYRMLTDRDVAVTILHEDVVAAAGVPRHLRAIYWPMPSVASDVLTARLATFVDRGGNLVSEAGPGEYTETGHRRPVVPSGPLIETFGVEQVETTTPRAGERIAIAGSEIAVAWQLESTRVGGASVIGRFTDGSPAVTRNNKGKGTAVLVSSYPSLAYGASADQRSAASMVALLGGRPETAVAWSEAAPGLVTRRARAADGRELTWAINWTGQSATLEANVPVAVIAGAATPANETRLTIESMSAALLAVGA